MFAGDEPEELPQFSDQIEQDVFYIADRMEGFGERRDHIRTAGTCTQARFLAAVSKRGNARWPTERFYTQRPDAGVA